MKPQISNVRFLRICLLTVGAFWTQAVRAQVSPVAQPDPTWFSADVSVAQFPDWIRQHLRRLDWPRHDYRPTLKRADLRQSFQLGRQFTINNQKPAGNFNYQYDFVTRTLDDNDEQVRQAGALWGLALMFQYDQDSSTKTALDRALAFFLSYTRPGPSDGTLLIAYPEASECRTGTVALVALGIVEYLRTEQSGAVEIAAGQRARLSGHLKGYLAFLKFMQREDKHFAASWSLSGGTKSADVSPYSDGETILCLVKAAKYLGFEKLIPLVEDTSLVLAKDYTIDEWRIVADSPLTKGFFQWSCMAFWEYYDAGWKHAETFGDCVLVLAWWMIHTHKTLDHPRNTGYAYEGILHAYRIADNRQNQAAMDDLAYTIDRGLFKLTGWQVGGPLQSHNRFLMANPTEDPLAVGGIMNHRREPLLRIDVAQHQMHAVLLALQHLDAVALNQE